MQEFALASCPGPTIYRNGLAAPGFGIGFDPLKVLEDVGKAAIAPGKLIVDIASGKNVADSALSAFKDQLKIVKGVAPYVQTVLSFVPGVGTGVSAAIGAGVALAEGQPITEVLKAGVKGALPGGPAAAAAFDMAMKVAAGQNVGEAALSSARNLIPGDAAKAAFDTGLAVAHGAKLQAKAKELGVSPATASIMEGGPPPAGMTIVQIMQMAQDAEKLRKAAAAKTAATVSPAVQAQTDLQKLAALSPEQQKRLVEYAQLAALTPDQQKQLVEYAKAKAAPPPPPPAAVKPAPAPAAPPKPVVAAAPPKPATPQAAKTVTVVKPTPVTTAPSPAPSSSTYAPYPSAATGLVSAPPMHGHGHGGGHGGHPGGGHGGQHSRGFDRIARGGRRDWGWGVPWSPEVVTREETCHVWSNPIAMPPAMERAARMALGASSGRPITVRGPDNILYLFSFDNGVLTARSCSSVSAA